MNHDMPEGRSTTSMHGKHATIFRLMDLPPELREEVYYHASPSFPPLDLSKPDIARVPAIAQLSRQTRKEALAVFYRNREIHMRLHCMRDILSTTGWLDSCASNAPLSNKIVVSGLLPCRSEYKLIILCSKNEPQFSAKIEHGLVEGVEETTTRTQHRHNRRCGRGCDHLEQQVSQYLESKTSWRPQDRIGRLTVGEMRSIINIIRKMTGWA